MKLFHTFFLYFLFIITISSCNNEEINPDQTIEIGSYSFDFPEGFEFKELNGIDSYVGMIQSNEITLLFDYGWYSSPQTNFSYTEFEVTEDEIQGHYRQIVKPLDPLNFETKLHLFKVSDTLNSTLGYNSLSLSAFEITKAEQEIVLEIFNSVEPSN